MISPASLPASAGTVILGSGCAGLNAADCLFDLGERDLIVVTDGLERGTSRNTGSDKQTYYKLSLSGDEGDSIGSMARSLFQPGSDGDVALAQAAGSAAGFLKLCRLGVPFPKNEYGEYVGYRTDHDVHSRASSAGPLTSRYMWEALLRSVRLKQIRLYEDWLPVGILQNEHGVLGIRLMNGTDGEIVTVRCDNLIVCTGGPALVYRDSVYPKEQAGSLGLLYRAGVKLCNLQIWQYGIASTDFRWNLSGSYQQVLPRYYSTDEFGNEYDFLAGVPWIDRFRKGYEWPYDPAKASGSSGIDLRILEQTRMGRSVWMDFRSEPDGLDLDRLHEEAYSYLEKSGALLPTPIARLNAMNPPAIRLYLDHGIDLRKEPLRIAVCAQHLNGGARVDANWQTCVPGLYVCGEAAGTFGTVRPGGSALNATQVGSMRAAEHIVRTGRSIERHDDCAADTAFLRTPGLNAFHDLQRRMSEYGAVDRDPDMLKQIAETCSGLLREGPPLCDLPAGERKEALYAAEAVLTTELAALSMCEPERPGILTIYRDGDHPAIERIPERPIPERDLWFESVWAKSRAGQ